MLDSVGTVKFPNILEDTGGVETLSGSVAELLALSGGAGGLPALSGGAAELPAWVVTIQSLTRGQQ